MNRMMIVFFASLLLAIIVSLARPTQLQSNLIQMDGVSFGTSAGFNIGGAVIIAILIALYAAWW
jgi:SSS family solute:Na+ symporter